MNLEDLQRLAQSGAVIVIQNLTINDYSQHLTVETLRTDAPLMLTPRETDQRDRVMQEQWENAGYL